MCTPLVTERIGRGLKAERLPKLIDRRHSMVRAWALSVKACRLRDRSRALDEEPPGKMVRTTRLCPTCQHDWSTMFLVTGHRLGRGLRIFFLASDDSKYVTCLDLVVDGDKPHAFRESVHWG